MSYLSDLVEKSKKARPSLSLSSKGKTEEELRSLLFTPPERAGEAEALKAEGEDALKAILSKPSPTPSSDVGAAISADVYKTTAELEEKRELELAEEQQREFEKASKKLVDSYKGVEIYQIAGDPLLFYKSDIVKPSLSERRIINTVREAATRLISIEPYEIRDPVQRKKVYLSKVLDIIDSAAADIQIPKTKREYFAEAVVREMIGFGLLDKLLEDDKLEDIMVIGENRPVYVFHRDHEMMKTNIVFYNEQDILDIIDKVARAVGRRIDRADPLLDARLPDGSRVNATIPPISIGGATLSIRKFRADPFSIIDLLNFGTINSELAAFLWLASDGMGVKPANVLIAGGTGSGKTSMLNVLCSLIPESDRVISIEDTAELQLPIQHWIRFEKRLPSLEGTGEISMAALVKNSLRMRPDRIIVGEVRGEEADTLFVAMNTGHDGSMGTIHANSAAETRVRVITPPMSVPESMLSGLDLIIVMQRIHLREKGTIRRVVEVAEVSGVLEGEAHMEVIYKWNPANDSIERTSLSSRYLQRVQDYTGMDRLEVEKELERRRDVIVEMQKKKIRAVLETSSAAKNYLLGRIGTVRAE
ncbi:MAG TPA: CpaF family protein [archaeon]|nr:CpaF family protein [archaeon]